MTRVGIAGIGGRMGRLVAEEAAAAGMTVVGGIGRAGSATGTFPDIASLAAAADIVIDFTNAATAATHAAALAAASVPWVLGSSGLDAAAEQTVRDAAGHIGIVYAANFSPGVVLLLDLAERMGAALPAGRYDAEIVEMHHRQKVDAPSGTAVALGRAVAAGRGVALDDVRRGGRDGETGPRRDGEIGFAALRGGQVVGEHSLIFAAADEQVILTHRAFDRRVFAAGAVQAAAWLAGRPPGLYGMRDVIGLA